MVREKPLLSGLDAGLVWASSGVEQSATMRKVRRVIGCLLMVVTPYSTSCECESSWSWGASPSPRPFPSEGEGVRAKKNAARGESRGRHRQKVGRGASRDQCG